MSEVALAIVILVRRYFLNSQFDDYSIYVVFKNKIKSERIWGLLRALNARDVLVTEYKQYFLLTYLFVMLLGNW